MITPVGGPKFASRDYSYSNCGKFREAVAGEIKPRTVMILVEWTSMWTANRHESQWRFLRLPLKGAISPP